MKIPFFDLTRQYAALRAEMAESVQRVFDSQQFILGKTVEAFERQFAETFDTPHAIGMSSGTDAQLAILMALGIGKGDAVITTPYTFFATAGCIARVGAEPVFVDVLPDTLTIDPAQVARLLDTAKDGRSARGNKIRAIIPVHLFGMCADMAPLSEIAERYNLDIIEDACQAVGTFYEARLGSTGVSPTHSTESNRRPTGIAATSTESTVSAGTPRHAGEMPALSIPEPIGSRSTAAFYSFFPTKNLGGAGDGGLATCRDAGFADALKRVRNHGMEKQYHHTSVGGNFRLDALQAAVLAVKLPRLAAWNQARRAHAAQYRAELGDLADLVLPADPSIMANVSRDSSKSSESSESRLINHSNPTNPTNPMNLTTPRAEGAESISHSSLVTSHYQHTYHQYVIHSPRRDAIKTALDAAEIGSMVYYHVPLHLQPCFADLGYKQGDMPKSERASRESLALPIFPELRSEEVSYICEVIRKAL